MKSLGSTVNAALAGATVNIVGFLDFQVSVGGVDVIVRYTTAAHDIEWGGATWLGMGRMMAIDTIREASAVEAVGLRVTLSGVPSELISTLLQAQVHGRFSNFYVGLYDENGTLLSTPWVEFSGRCDTMQLTDEQSSAQIVLSIESRLVSLLQAKKTLWTNAEQQAQYPGPPPDDGFRYVNTTVERTLAFGPRR